jgi:hypothetical protein
MVASVPEPSTVLLLIAAGLCGLPAVRKVGTRKSIVMRP